MALQRLPVLTLQKMVRCAHIKFRRVDPTGRKVIIMNVLTKKLLDDTLRDVKFSGIAWNHNDGFYYSSYDKPKEGSQLAAKHKFINYIIINWAHRKVKTN